MLPTGKPEPIRCEVGFYFSDGPPSNLPVILRLGPSEIDIPPGESARSYSDEYVLPIDVTLLNVYPHAHLLAREMRAYATPPGKAKICLLDIAQWDFNWQDEYQYRTPIDLPQGTTVEMEFVYDNSTQNVRNPFDPPQRITLGPRTTDEMGDLWLQVVPKRPREREILAGHFGMREDEAQFRQYAFLTRVRPDFIVARNEYGVMLDMRGRHDEARHHLKHALSIDPDNVPSLHNLGVVEMGQENYDKAAELLEQARRLAPNFPDPKRNLGMVRYMQGQFEASKVLLTEYLKTNRFDTEAHLCIANARQRLGDTKAALGHLQFVLSYDPSCVPARQMLQEFQLENSK